MPATIVAHSLFDVKAKMSDVEALLAERTLLYSDAYPIVTVLQFVFTLGPPYNIHDMVERESISVKFVQSEDKT